MEKVVGFIGGGAMGEALIAGLLRQKLVSNTNILVSDLDPKRLAYLAQKYNIHTVTDNDTVVRQAEVVVLAVKPQVLTSVFANLNASFTNLQLVISIVAGIPLQYLTNEISVGVPIVRVMPNTPCLVGKGVCAIACGNAVKPQEQEIAEQILKSVGKVLLVKESMLDGVTAISGSGPAYFYLIIEALCDAGVRVGLPRSIAKELVLETLVGSAAMVSETGLHPAELKDMVTSPAGTTIAAVAEFEKAGFRGILMEAAQAAFDRSQELSKLTEN